MIALPVQARFGRGEAGNALLREGWRAPENGFVWSVGAQSRLDVPLDAGDGVLTLELTVTPHVHPPRLPRQRLELRINGVSVATRRLVFAETLRLDVPPEAMRGAKSLEIVLLHPDAASPAALGTGADARVLGFRLSALTLLHMAARYVPPAQCGARRAVTFGCGGNHDNQPALIEGFGTPEADFVWAVGRHSVLRLPASPSLAAQTILLDMKPCVAPPALPRQRIAIGADGHLLGFAALTDRTVLGFDLPPPTPGAAYRELTFDNLDAATAAPGQGIYHDGRPMAFMLCSVRLIGGPRLPDDGAPPRAALPGRLDDGGLQQHVLDLTGVPAAEIAGSMTSLGGACELGLLQRRLGHEANGMLRFAGMPTHHLVQGILSGFRGLGRQDTMTLFRRDDFDCGYWMQDSAYFMGLQTPLSSLVFSEEAVLRQLSRALPFLARKFCEEASLADRIFVFQRRDPTTRPEADAVRAALSVWGDVTVLWVVQDPARAGCAQRLSPRLLQGWVDETGMPGYGSDDAWMSMLANAWMLMHAA